jgi:hypothetical protein
MYWWILRGATALHLSTSAQPVICWAHQYPVAKTDNLPVYHLLRCNVSPTHTAVTHTNKHEHKWQWYGVTFQNLPYGLFHMYCCNVCLICTASTGLATQEELGTALYPPAAVDYQHFATCFRPEIWLNEKTRPQHLHAFAYGKQDPRVAVMVHVHRTTSLPQPQQEKNVARLS